MIKIIKILICVFVIASWISAHHRAETYKNMISPVACSEPRGGLARGHVLDCLHHRTGKQFSIIMPRGTT